MSMGMSTTMGISISIGIPICVHDRICSRISLRNSLCVRTRISALVWYSLLWYVDVRIVLSTLLDHGTLQLAKQETPVALGGLDPVISEICLL